MLHYFSKSVAKTLTVTLALSETQQMILVPVSPLSWPPASHLHPPAVTCLKLEAVRSRVTFSFFHVPTHGVLQWK